MMMMMYSLHSTLPTLPAVICWQRLHHRCQDGYHVDGADCCLIGIILGVTMKKISPNNNTTQYLQILPSTQQPNASIILTLQAALGYYSILTNLLFFILITDRLEQWSSHSLMPCPWVRRADMLCLRAVGMELRRLSLCLNWWTLNYQHHPNPVLASIHHQIYLTKCRHQLLLTTKRYFSNLTYCVIFVNTVYHGSRIIIIIIIIIIILFV